MDKLANHAGILAAARDRYHAPIVLCDLEAQPLDAVVRRFGWPLGTVKSRLNYGRLRLRERLRQQR